MKTIHDYFVIFTFFKSSKPVIIFSY